MKKLALCVLTCFITSGLNAQTWERVITSGPSFSDQLNNPNAVAVDNQGFVHAQSANFRPSDSSPFLYHLYTLNSEGEFPWIWDLESGQDLLGCGVFGRDGNRIDCLTMQGQGFPPITVLKLVKRIQGQQSWALTLSPDIVALDALAQLPSGEAIAITRDVAGQAVMIQISSTGIAISTELGNPCASSMAYRFGALEISGGSSANSRLAFVCDASLSEQTVVQFEVTQSGTLLPMAPLQLPANVQTINKLVLIGQDEAFILTDQKTIYLASAQAWAVSIYQLSGRHYIKDLLATSEGFAAVYGYHDSESKDSGVVWGDRFGGIYAQVESAWINQHNSKFAVADSDQVVAAGIFDQSVATSVSTASARLDAVLFSQDGTVVEFPSVLALNEKGNEHFSIGVSAPENVIIVNNTESPTGISVRQFAISKFKN